MSDLTVFTPEYVVELAGISRSEAYAWGCESGVFMETLRAARGSGRNGFREIFHTGNLGMIIMVAGEYGYDVEVVSTSGEWADCWVSKR